MENIKRTAVAGLICATTAISSVSFAADAIKIGVVTPLSGTYAAVGQPVRWGLELAAHEINAAGGIGGRQVALIFEDEEANPSVAVQKAERLFQVEKVDFLTGMVNSGSTLAVGQLAERAIISWLQQRCLSPTRLLQISVRRIYFVSMQEPNNNLTR